MKSLRARLFAATLAALAITLGLTVAIGGILTRRQVDRTQAATIARLADDRAPTAASTSATAVATRISARSA